MWFVLASGPNPNYSAILAGLNETEIENYGHRTSLGWERALLSHEASLHMFSDPY